MQSTLCDYYVKLSRYNLNKMISRRDNLLIRPWELKRFENHRRKVQSALPAIDTKPPASRQHVALKLKQKQKEWERCEEIEKNNFLLLKRLSHTMKTSRVDNYWTNPQPNFLNRVSMYGDVIEPRLEDFWIESSIEDMPEPRLSRRKQKCMACAGQKPEETNVPEDRVPWEPQKPPVSRRRSKSVPVRKPDIEKPPPISLRSSATANKKKEPKPKKTDFSSSAKRPQSIILRRGCLELSVNFPSDTQVKLQKGNVEKMLVQGVCNCSRNGAALII